MLAQWWHTVASSEALDLLYRAVHAVSYRRTATAIKLASKVGAFFHYCCISCHPGSRLRNTEQVVALWQHPEASGVALDMLHWAIQAALQPCIYMAIEAACNRGAFVCYCCSFA